MVSVTQNFILKGLSIMRLPISFVFLMSISYIIPYEWSILKVIIGAMSFFLIPGYCLVQLLLNDYEQTKKLIFSFIFGFVVQLFNILFFYVLSPFFSNQINILASGDVDLVYEQILSKELDIRLALFLLTLIFVIALSVAQIIRSMRHPNTKKRENLTYIKKTFPFFLLILILSLIIRLYYQSFINAPATDGALYLDQARSLVITGKFTSKVVGVVGPTFFWNQLGLSSHLFTYFSIALFFLIGGVDFFVAKLMTVFIGMLLVFMIYELSEKLYSRQVAIVASIIATIHPLLIHYSAVIYGPEILGIFFTLSAYYFFLISTRGDAGKYAIIAGVMAFLSLHTTNYAFIAFLITVVFYVVVFTFKRQPVLPKIISMTIFSSTLFVVINITALQPLSSIPTSYWALVIFMLVASILVILKQRNDQYLLSVLYMFITIGVLSSLTEIRAFHIFNVIPQSVLHSARVPSVEADFLFVVNNMLSNFADNFVTLLSNNFLNYAAETISYLLLFFSFLIFRWPKKLRENITIFSYTFFFLILVVLGGWAIPNWYLYSKLMLFVTPFFILLAAFSLIQLTKHLPSIRIHITIAKSHYWAPLSKLCVVLCLLFGSLIFMPTYSSYIGKMNTIGDTSFGIGFYNHMEPAIEWLQANTSQSTVIMSTKPYDMAWFTDRITIFILNLNATKPEDYYNLDILDLVYLIHRFKANYIMVDYYNTFDIPAVTDLYENPYNFDIAFQYIDRYGRKVVLYNVTSISYSDNPFAVIDRYILEAERFSIVKKDLEGYPISRNDAKASMGLALIFSTQNPESVGAQEVHLKVNGYGDFLIGVKARSAWQGNKGVWDTGLSLFIDGDTVGGLLLSYPMNDYRIYETGTVHINGTSIVSIAHTHHTDQYWAWTYIDQVIFYPLSSDWKLKITP